MSTESRDEIVNNAIEDFEDAKEILKFKFDINSIVDKIKKIKIISKALPLDIAGYYYHGMLKAIILNKNNYERRSIFHEFIHGITGKNMAKYNLKFMRGFMEGETENIVEDVYGSDTSYMNSIFDDKIHGIEFNFSDSDTAYRETVAIIKQMEYLLGEKSYDSILKGNMQFEKNFSNVYGNKLMNFLKFRTRMLVSNNNISLKKVIKGWSDTEYFKDTQDIFLKKAFDLEFQKVSDVNSARLFFERLRNFETVRARIYYDYGEIDTFFSDYYTEKYKDCVERLEKSGISVEEISNQLEDYKYKRQNFKPMLTKEEQQELIKDELFRTCIINNIKFDCNKFECKSYKVSTNTYTLVIINKEDQNTYICYLNQYHNIDDFEMQENFEREIRKNGNEHNFDEWKKFFEKYNCEEERIDISNIEFQSSLCEYVERNNGYGLQLLEELIERHNNEVVQKREESINTQDSVTQKAEESKIILPNEIGKATIGVSHSSKEKAQQVLSQDIKEHELEENQREGVSIDGE